MIELLIVMLLVSVLGAVAIPKFLDFRNEGKAAQLRYVLNALRIGIKNQTQQARLKCAVAPTPSNLTLNLVYNDVTYWSNDATKRLCTVSEIPNASERPFWNFPSSQLAHEYNAGADLGVGAGATPANPFISANSATLIYPIVGGVSDANVQAKGGNCGWVDFYVGAASTRFHWWVNTDTLEVFPGTNTSGINECSF